MSEGIALQILNLGIRWRRVVSFMPGRFSPWERDPGTQWFGLIACLDWTLWKIKQLLPLPGIEPQFSGCWACSVVAIPTRIVTRVWKKCLRRNFQHLYPSPNMAIKSRTAYSTYGRDEKWIKKFFGKFWKGRSRDSVVGIATGCGLDDRGVGVRGPLGSNIFSTSSRPALGSTQPHIQWVPGTLSPGVRGQRREAGHSPVTSAEVKKMWIYKSTPRTPSWPTA
jgi:hypothetical protein